MKKRFSFIFFSGLIILYFIFCPHRIEKELIIVPSWVTEIYNLNNTNNVVEILPFRFNKSFGYYTPKGSLIFSEKIKKGVAITKDFFVNYPEKSSSLIFQNYKGEKTKEIKTYNIPFTVDEHFFTTSPDRMIIKKYDKNGKELFIISPGSMVTTIDAGDAGISVGTLSGELYVYDNNGKNIFKYFSTESRYSVVYSCAVNKDASKLSVITGLSPQKLICFERRNDSYVQVFEKIIKNEYRRNVLLDYSNDANYLYMELQNKLEIFDTGTYESSFTTIKGKIEKVVFFGEGQLFYILTSREGKSFLRILRSNKKKIAEFYFPSEQIFFHPYDNCFYIGLNEQIIRYDIIEG